MAKPLTTGPGDVHTRLTIIEQADSDRNGVTYWLCRCECGRVVRVRSDNLTQKHTKSCGCWKRDAVAERNRRRAAER